MVKIVYDADMAAEIINLRQVRKQLKRADADTVAAENRAKHGITKSARKQKELEEKQAKQHLDGHKLEGDADDSK